MRKVRTTINLNEDVVRKAKYFKINISSIAERAIIDYIKELENIGKEYTKPNNPNCGNDSTHNSKQISNKKDKMGSSRFELELPAPQAGRMAKLPHEPNFRPALMFY